MASGIYFSVKKKFISCFFYKFAADVNFRASPVQNQKKKKTSFHFKQTNKFKSIQTYLGNDIDMYSTHSDQQSKL